MKIGIHNIETDSNVVRDMTAEEIAEFEAQANEYNARKEAEQAEKNAKELKRKAIAEKLGLDEEELAALVS